MVLNVYRFDKIQINNDDLKRKEQPMLRYRLLKNDV